MSMVLMVIDFSNITMEEVSLAITGYIIVFFVLMLIYLVFNNMPQILKSSRKMAQWYQNRNAEEKESNGMSSQKEAPGELEISAEENAAISAAIYLYINETHDEEQRVLTKKPISKTYSPWSSKIYTVHNFR